MPLEALASKSVPVDTIMLWQVPSSSKKISAPKNRFPAPLRGGKHFGPASSSQNLVQIKTDSQVSGLWLPLGSRSRPLLLL